MSVILNSIFTSSFTFLRASITSISFCLFTWMAYHAMFTMEMTWTKGSCCFVCSCISRFICHLISVVSFIMAVHVNLCSASPKKGSRLLWVVDYKWVIICQELVQSGVIVLPFVWSIYMIGRCCQCW